MRAHPLTHTHYFISILSFFKVKTKLCSKVCMHVHVSMEDILVSPKYLLIKHVYMVIQSIQCILFLEQFILWSKFINQYLSLSTKHSIMPPISIMFKWDSKTKWISLPEYDFDNPSIQIQQKFGECHKLRFACHVLIN